MRFTKVKLNPADGKITLEWEGDLENEHTERHGLESDDPALPSLGRALQALRPHFLGIMGLPDDYGEDMEVRGVTLKWAGPFRIKSATISVVKKLLQTGEVASINTPHTEAGLTHECIEALEALCNEAERYVEGERAQLSLYPAA